MHVNHHCFALFTFWEHKTFFDDLIWLDDVKLQPLFYIDQELEHHVLPLETHGATNATRQEAQ